MATAAWKACWRMQPQQGRQHPWSRTNRPEAGVGRSWSLPMQKQYISQMSLHRCIRKCQKLSEVGDLRTAMSPRHFWVVSQIISWWFQGVGFFFFSPKVSGALMLSGRGLHNQAAKSNSRAAVLGGAAASRLLVSPSSRTTDATNRGKGRVLQPSHWKLFLAICHIQI